MMSVYIAPIICLVFITISTVIVIYNMSLMAIKDREIKDLTYKNKYLENNLGNYSKMEARLERELSYSKSINDKLNISNNRIEYYKDNLAERDKEIQILNDIIDRMKAVDDILASGAARNATLGTQAYPHAEAYDHSRP